MAVCDVVHYLANSPASFAIRCIEFRRGKLTASSAKVSGSFGNHVNRLLAQRRVNVERRLKLSNRVTRIHGDRGLLRNFSPMTNEASPYLTCKTRIGDIRSANSEPKENCKPKW